MEDYTTGTCCYDYTDAEGRLLYQVVRSYPKKFYQRRLVNNKWVYNLDGVEKVLYRLPELIESKIVFIVEGEKDVEFLREKLKKLSPLGAWNEFYHASVTTCSGGSGAWKDKYNKYFKDKHIFILPDNDKPGIKLAQNIACGIFDIARSVCIILLPGISIGGDVSDWLMTASIEKLIQICYSIEPLIRTDIEFFKPKKTKHKRYEENYFDLNHTGYGRGIDSTMIDLALKYPIYELIDVNRAGMAFCINPEHEDKHRSMDTRKNFMYCYGCGYHANVIKLAQWKWKCNFVTAVKRLYHRSFKITLDSPII